MEFVAKFAATGHRPGKTRGFTLIELLVVTAVVAILAAILFPVFLAVRENGRQAACLSNQRQIGLALMQYAQDQDERLPNGILPAGTDYFWSGEGWAGQCSAYLHSTAVLDCPDDPTAPDGPRDPVVSYGYNINLVQGDGWLDERAAPGLTLADIAAPAKTVMLFEVSGITANAADSQEGAGLGGQPGRYLSASGNGLDNRLYAHKTPDTDTDNLYATGYLGGRATTPDGQFRPAQGRHDGGADYLLADGHVQWLRGDAVSSGLAAAQSTDPQGATQNGFSAAGTEAFASRVHATFSPR